MDNWSFYIWEGFWHVLDITAYDHILFIILLVVPFVFKNWRQLLLLVSSFTLGHTISLLLVNFGELSLPTPVIEFLIPVTIALTALYNLFTAHIKRRDKNQRVTAIIALAFGLIHGFGFSGAFKMLAFGTDQNLFLLLLKFALGIEGAQLMVVLAVLILNYIFTLLTSGSRKEWIQIVSSIILGIVIPMLIERWIW